MTAHRLLRWRTSETRAASDNTYVPVLSHISPPREFWPALVFAAMRIPDHPKQHLDASAAREFFTTFLYQAEIPIFVVLCLIRSPTCLFVSMLIAPTPLYRSATNAIFSPAANVLDMLLAIVSLPEFTVPAWLHLDTSSCLPERSGSNE